MTPAARIPRTSHPAVRASAIAALLCCVTVSPIAVVPDPGAPGPLAVTVEEYDFGDEAFTPSDLAGAVEFRASVHYPTGLPGGPYPLVVFLHGRHDACYEPGDSAMQWPCEAPLQPIPSYRGYDYVAEVLASHGYIVVSISANGINAQDDTPDDLGALARAELIQEHLGYWSDLSTVGGVPFGDKFVGKVDMQNIGTMGHSRGGEGAVRHVHLNAGQGSPYGMRAVFALAPLNAARQTIHDVPFAVLLPYCDGDVNTLEGVSYFDDSRYNAPGDAGPKHTILVLGAIHNFYNTNWTPSIFPEGSLDDWEDWGSDDVHCGPDEPNGRLTEAEQRGTGVAYLAAFFRTYLGDESVFRPLLISEPPPASAMTDGVYVAYHPPDDPAVRLDVNRLLQQTNLSINTPGGAAGASGLDPYDLCAGPAPNPSRCLPEALYPSKEPHSALDSSAPGMSQLRLGWDDALARYSNDLPAGTRNVSGYAAVQFRASVNFSDDRNPAGLDQDLSVTLVDGAGFSSSVRAADHTRSLFYPPGSPPDEFDSNLVPRVVLNTVRIPLEALSGVFLTDIRSLRLDFDRTGAGAVLLGDLMFADEAADKPPAVTCSVEIPVLQPGQHNLVNVGLGVEVSDDLDPDPAFEVSVFGDEDDEAADGGDSHSPDAKDPGEGTLRLRAERLGEGDGRVYLILATSEDSGGQLGYDCCTVVVPRGQGAASTAAVQAQAAAALDQCTAFVAYEEGLAALPAGSFVVGDGPVIGPKQ